MSQSSHMAPRPASATSSSEMNSAHGTLAALSIVVPCHNEAANLTHLLREISSHVPAEWISEIILVDDGSTDDTWKVIAELADCDNRVVGIRLSRNFGHQYALFAGLERASGAAVVSMDADLQHPPEVILELVSKWLAGAKIVHTVREDAATASPFKRWSSALYYRIFSFLSGVPLQKGMADFRLLDRDVVNTLQQFKEEGLFLRGLVHWVGYPSTTIPYRCGQRYAGETSYTLRKMIALAWTGITSFSLVPLRISIVLGLLTSLLAFGEIVYAVVMKLTTGSTVPGWASAVSIISLLFGMLFILLGVIGEYLGRVLSEVRGRPRYIVAEELSTSTPPKKLAPQ